MRKHFCMGMFKTGTTSYSRAMHRLGLVDLHFPPKYVEQLIAYGVQPFTLRKWDSMSNVHEVEYRECEALYPDAKFILTTRDVEPWLKSIKRHMGGSWPPHLKRAFDARFTRIYGVPCTSAAFDEALFRRVFIQHAEQVRDHFGDRVLVLDLDAGDDLMLKLSAFVGNDVAWPHVNKGKGFLKPGEPVTIRIGRQYRQAS